MKYLIYILCFSFSIASIAQDFKVDLSYYLPKQVTYTQNIPTPKSIIGHEVGEWHITHDKLVQYMYALANASNRITIENRGSTYEGRPLVLLTITSPNNHTNISSIQKQHVALTEKDASSLDTSTMPIVVNQGFSIHGNEASGSNAALAVAYYLAAAEGPEIDKLLQNTVILLDPSFNPDGLQRFSTWVNIHKNKTITTDPNDREYSEVWPGGRTNHYWFDMNRDWLPVQLPESRVRIKTFHSWYPNIVTDHHEMGTNASFFFQPGIPSRTHPLTPQKNQDLTGAIAKFHARALDKLGSFYYTEESFDDFYYGKGSTFPDINGSIGILFEQASSRGHAQESDNGVLTFPFTIRNQFTAALSTLEAAVTMRQEILDYQRSFFENARNEAAKQGAFIFGNEKDASSTFHLAEILNHHKIEFYELKNDVELDGKMYKKGYSYIVPKNQKQHRLINAMIEKRTSFQDSLFYDISAWSFPLAFNMDHSEKVSMSQAGNKVTNLTPPIAKPIKTSNYAYIMEWQEYYSPAVLYALTKKGIRAKVGMKPFSLENSNFDYGSILIPVQNQNLNTNELAAFLSELASKYHVNIKSVSTGLTQGIDLGSNAFKAVKEPKIALVVGRGITPYDAGEIWHLLDQRFEIPVTKIDAQSLAYTDLSRYTDIILPNSWGSALNEEDSEIIEGWIKDGGTLIAYKNAGRWLDKNKLMELSFTSKKDTATTISFEQKSNYFGAQVIGGAIFETELDRSHPIAFGYKNKKMPIFRNSTLFLEADIQSYNNPIKYTESPLLSGYISDKNLKLLSKTVPLQIKRSGQGRIIYFTDNTNFRAFWYGTNKLLMNAIFFGHTM